MFKKLLELEPKYVATIITSVGGIILAYIIFGAYQTLAEVKTVEIANGVKDLSANVASLKEASFAQVESNKQVNETLKELQRTLIQSRSQANNRLIQ